MMRKGLLIRTGSGSALLMLAALVTLAATPETRALTETDARFQYDDLAALASREPRAELSCQVTSDKPVLGFDLHFHSEYHVTVPIKVLADAGGWLQMAIRVTPTPENEHPAY